MLEILNYKEMDYYLYKPDDFDLNNKYPLIVFLHGAGEREKVEDTISHGPICSIRNGMKIDAIILCPHCHGDNLWVAYYERVDELINIYRNKEYIDIDKVSLTGLSMGAYAAFDVAIIHSDYYSCLMPVCGGGKPFCKYYYKDMKVRIFQGDKDDIVDVSESVKMYEAIKMYNNNCELIIYKGYGHSIWDITYENIDNINFLINSKRNQ